MLIKYVANVRSPMSAMADYANGHIVVGLLDDDEEQYSVEVVEEWVRVLTLAVSDYRDAEQKVECN